jgi:predicted transglutaminase-like cysteine proteinase
VQSPANEMQETSMFNKSSRAVQAAMLALFVSSMCVGGANAGRVHAPLGYQLMCLKTPSACQGGGSAKVQADQQLMVKLKRVNSAVNRTMTPVEDGAADVWNANARQGDCEEFALAKRAALIREGVPASSLRLAYVKTRSGEGHAVLVVKSSRGDLVLDVLTHKIRPLSQSGLRLMSIAGANPTHWS